MDVDPNKKQKMDTDPAPEEQKSLNMPEFCNHQLDAMKESLMLQNVVLQKLLDLDNRIVDITARLDNRL